jgi:hypothetical protein
MKLNETKLKIYNHPSVIFIIARVLEDDKREVFLWSDHNLVFL